MSTNPTPLLVAQDVNVTVQVRIKSDLSEVATATAHLTVNGVLQTPRPVTVSDDGTATGTATVTFDAGTLPDAGLLIVDIVFEFTDGRERTLESLVFSVRDRVNHV